MPPRGCLAVRSRHNRLRRTRRAFKRPRASLKDLGHKCFGFTKMDAGEIRRIKTRDRRLDRAWGDLR